jgi:formylglycine-generating enzyme required for sulfatase activity
MKSADWLSADIETWRAASPLQRDDCLAELARALGPSFQAIEVHDYASAPIARLRHEPSGQIFHLIPGGAGQLGAEHTPFPWDKPLQRTQIASFLLAESLLSQASWDRLAADIPDERQWRGAELPIEKITLRNALRWLEKAGLRLPSESEWEFAARAMTRTRFPWGEALDPSQVWYYENSGGHSWPVLAHDSARNGFGLVDMLGNLWEWCADFFQEGHQNHSGDERPRPRPEDAEPRNVYKGTGWNALPQHVEVSNRNGRGLDHAFSMIGLRPAISLPSRPS